MTRWLRMLTSGGRIDGQQFISPKMFRELTTPLIAISPTTSYAVGWAVYDWNGLRVWSGMVSSQHDEILGRWLEGGETQYIIDFADRYNKVLEQYVKNLMVMPTNWKDVIFSPVDRAAVRPLDNDQILPKTVPQGYTNRAPAVAGRALPSRDSAQPQH